MNFVFTESGIRIGRDVTDTYCRREAAVITRALLALNNGDNELGDWQRFFPCKHGNLTDSKIGIKNRSTGEIYWHGNHQIEAAHEAFNSGALFLNKA